jgi:hypothetical protein
MIVISAASGALGRLVIDQLRTRAEVVAAVRDPGRAPEGVEVRRGDYDDPARDIWAGPTISPALCGVTQKWPRRWA